MSPAGRLLAPDAGFESYYGRAVLKEPAWKVPDVPLYFLLGGMAGASSVLGAAADLTGRGALARVTRVTASAGALGSVAALIHDLGRPARFLNMLRVLKPTSPLSVGSWTIASYGPMAGAAAVSDLLRVAPLAGRAAGLGAAALGPVMSTYTGTLIADTAVPAWYEAHAELPFAFGGGALASAAGVALAAAPLAEAGPARRGAVAGSAIEITATEVMRRRPGLVGEPYRTGRAGRLTGSGQCAVRRRRAHGAARPPVTAGIGPGRGPARDRLGSTAVRGLRGRRAVRPRPQIHDRPAARAPNRGGIREPRLRVTV